MELFSLQSMPREAKLLLLKELGYGSDGTYVTKDGHQVIDRYVDEAVRVDNMLIFPGSTLVLDNNPLSVASYLEEHGDVF